MRPITRCYTSLRKMMVVVLLPLVGFVALRGPLQFQKSSVRKSMMTYNNNNNKIMSPIAAASVDEKKKKKKKCGGNKNKPVHQVTTMPNLSLTKHHPNGCLLQFKTSNATCFNLDHPDYRGGWGNTVFQILYAFITNHNQQTTGLPCVLEGGLGNLVTNLFTNLVKCDSNNNNKIHYEEKKCVAFRGVRNRHCWFNEIWPLVKDPETYSQRQFLLQLNETYVLEKFFLGSCNRLQKIQTSCGIHVRFGDAFFRKSARDNRINLPQCKSNHKDNMGACFLAIWNWITTTACPTYDHNKSVSIFVATDYPPFQDFLIEHNSATGVYSEILRTDISNVNGTLRHINDIRDDNDNDKEYESNPHFVNLISDWISLGLANKTNGFVQSRESTLVETAKLGLNL